MNAPIQLCMLIAGAFLLQLGPALAQKKNLTVASWGGAYAQSQQIAYFRPFEQDTGIPIMVVYHGGKPALLGKGREYRFGNWDVVDMSADALESACRDGFLEPIDQSSLANAGNGTPAGQDFMAGGLHECGVASVAWSSVIVYDGRTFGGKRPQSASDFFDLKAYPGKRALKRSAKYTLELALLADGVKPDDVYTQLASETGLKRALGVLDRIKDDIVWWSGGEEPLRMLADGQVVMANAFNGRAFNSKITKNQALTILWDGQIYTMNSWAIPKSSQNKDAARAFIAFATTPARLARQASWFPYGPMRKSALGLVGKHAEIDVEMSSFLPTSKANMKHALQLNAVWWLKHGEAVEARFTAWLDAQATQPGDNVHTSSADRGDDDPKTTASP